MRPALDVRKVLASQVLLKLVEPCHAVYFRRGSVGISRDGPNPAMPLRSPPITNDNFGPRDLRSRCSRFSVVCASSSSPSLAVCNTPELQGLPAQKARQQITDAPRPALRMLALERLHRLASSCHSRLVCMSA